jgi:hypothetical protein
VVLEESVEVISFGGSFQKRVLSGFGVEKAAHGIEHTEIQSENFHRTYMDSLCCKRRFELVYLWKTNRRTVQE